MWKILRPPKHKPPVAAEKIDKEYKRLRLQVFIGIFIGYAGYYLVRKNFTLAMPHLVEMGFDKGDLGIALSANAIAYGLSKFLMGGVSDRSNARVFLPLGLVLSALVTMFLGTSAGISSIIMMFITQFLIGWFQGMGWPPCGRVMTHWFSQNERGTKMSIWNVAHNVGGGMIGPMAAYGLLWFGSWQIGTFWFPAVVAIVVAMLAFLLIRDTPQRPGSRPSRNTATTTRKITARSRSRSLRRRKSSSNTYSTTRYSGISPSPMRSCTWCVTAYWTGRRPT